MIEEDIYAQVAAEENMNESIRQQQIESNMKNIQNWETYNPLKTCMKYEKNHFISINL